MKINREPLTTLTDDIYKKGPRVLEQILRAAHAATGSPTTPASSKSPTSRKKFTSGQQLRRLQGRPEIHPRRRRAEGVFQIAQFHRRRVCVALSQSMPAGIPPKTQAADEFRRWRETDFAFKQSFAFCPYSPEAVYRYVNFLLQLSK
jgi:hypothetical protein